MGGNGTGRRRGQATKGLLALALGAVLLGATACGGSAGASTNKDHQDGKNGSVAGGSGTPASQASVSISPKNGATGVDTTGALRVSAAKGKLTKVTVTGPDGTPVDGAISADGSSWTPSGTLRTHARYTVQATAADSSGRTTAQQSSFTTLTPSAVNYGVFNVNSGSTYGVGMEISIHFNKPVDGKDMGAVHKGITVTASNGVDVEGHWFGSNRIDFRPEHYWAPGTKVTLHLRLDGVKTAPGVYGQQSKDVSFTIGRSQTSIADNDSKTLKIYRDGRLYRTFPASLGDAQHTTYNGKMVIEEKSLTVDMDSRTVGLGNAYHIKDVPHGMRLSDSGTFAHGNYWRPLSTFGHENTSHGCVGLHDVKGGGDPNTPAAWFYDNSLIGDVVEVVNSPDKVIQPDNGINGWNMSWAAWKTN